MSIEYFLLRMTKYVSQFMGHPPLCTGNASKKVVIEKPYLNNVNTCETKINANLR